MNLKTKKKIAPYLYVMPVLILLLIMYGYPLIKSIIMSLQDYKLTSSGSAPFNIIYNKNSPTSAGSEMNCRSEHKCSKEFYK